MPNTVDQVNPGSPATPTSFTRHNVAADGDCGYTAFGITRQHAYQLIRERVTEVRDILKPVIEELLLSQGFLQYLIDRDIASRALSIAFLKYQHAASQGGEMDPAIIEQLKSHANDLTVVNAYLDYDIIEKQIDAGWSHPGVLQAIAHLQQIQLHIWKLNNQNQLLPHSNEYAVYTPAAPQSSVHLLFVNNNHFERLEHATSDVQKTEASSLTGTANYLNELQAEFASLQLQKQNPQRVTVADPSKKLKAPRNIEPLIEALVFAVSNNTDRMVDSTETNLQTDFLNLVKVLCQVHAPEMDKDLKAAALIGLQVKTKSTLESIEKTLTKLNNIYKTRFLPMQAELRMRLKALHDSPIFSDRDYQKTANELILLHAVHYGQAIYASKTPLDPQDIIARQHTIANYVDPMSLTYSSAKHEDEYYPMNITLQILNFWKEVYAQLNSLSSGDTLAFSAEIKNGILQQKAFLEHYNKVHSDIQAMIVQIEQLIDPAPAEKFAKLVAKTQVFLAARKANLPIPQDDSSSDSHSDDSDDEIDLQPKPVMADLSADEREDRLLDIQDALEHALKEATGQQQQFFNDKRSLSDLFLLNNGNASSWFTQLFQLIFNKKSELAQENLNNQLHGHLAKLMWNNIAAILDLGVAPSIIVDSQEICTTLFKKIALLRQYKQNKKIISNRLRAFRLTLRQAEFDDSITSYSHLLPALQEMHQLLDKCEKTFNEAKFKSGDLRGLQQTNTNQSWLLPILDSYFESTSVQLLEQFSMLKTDVMKMERAIKRMDKTVGNGDATKTVELPVSAALATPTQRLTQPITPNSAKRKQPSPEIQEQLRQASIITSPMVSPLPSSTSKKRSAEHPSESKSAATTLMSPPSIKKAKLASKKVSPICRDRTSPLSPSKHRNRDVEALQSPYRPHSARMVVGMCSPQARSAAASPRDENMYSPQGVSVGGEQLDTSPPRVRKISF